MIRVAGAADAPQVMAGLQALAATMGDPFRLNVAQLARALDSGAARAVLHERGLALWSPFVSTSRGAMGAYVSDLWVEDGARGQGLGVRLLAAVRDQAAADYGAVFLRLAVYAGNPGARQFYDRLGFAPKPDETWLTLEGAALEAI